MVGRDGGYVARTADVSVLVPTVNEERVTAHTEGMCAVVWHLLVSHPALQAQRRSGSRSADRQGLGVGPPLARRRWCGFIGGHFVGRLLADPDVERVTVFDNFTSGREWHLEPSLGDARLAVVRGDVKELEALVDAAAGHDVAIHLASNPDIARAPPSLPSTSTKGRC